MTSLLLILIPLMIYAPVFNTQERDARVTEYTAYLLSKEKQAKINQLMQTIRFMESRDRYDVVGGSGEYGAYQYMPSTWKYYCLKFMSEVLDITIPENQDLITQKKIELLVDKGYSVEQIAAFWNSGTITYHDKRGINSFGVYYDVPAYVGKFVLVYNELET